MKKLRKMIYKFTHLSIGGKEIRCPYTRTIFQPNMIRIPGPFFVCKKPPRGIKKTVERRAKKLGINLKTLPKRQIFKFMKKQRIGIDCSGFVYWVLDAFYRGCGKKSWVKKLELVPGRSKNPARRLNVNAFTNEINSVEIKKVKDMQCGDLIKFNFADTDGDGIKHLAIIVNIGDNNLEYYHSSSLTKTSGVHKGLIRIIDFEAGLGKQIWLEKTKSGENFGKKYFCPKAGDKIVRLKV